MSENLYVSKSTAPETVAILEGKRSGKILPMGCNGLGRITNQGSGEFIIISRPIDLNTDFNKPLVLISSFENLSLFFGYIAQLKNHLSPVSSWCYIFASDLTNDIFEMEVIPKYNGLTGAWVGASIAEAYLLIDKPIGELKIAACLATHSFALAKAIGLWPKTSKKEIILRMETIKSIIKREFSSNIIINKNLLRDRLDPIWECLLLATTEGSTGDSRYVPIAKALSSFLESQSTALEQSSKIISKYLDRIIPEASLILDLPRLSSEQRLQLFNKILSLLEKYALDSPGPTTAALSFIAGYLILVMAGGQPNLSLAEKNAKKFPEILTWAYVLGGTGERRLWTSVFDGLGRLVARELARPFRAIDPPTCDIAFEEACALVDPHLSDPLVHMRLKQSRIATIGLFPGVNVNISLSEPAFQEVRKQDRSMSYHRNEAPSLSKPSNDPWNLIADAIWPYIERKISEKSVQYPPITREESPNSLKSKRSKNKPYYGTKPMFEDD